MVNRYSNLILAGIILLAFGVTLAATSYFKLYDTVEEIVPTSGLILIPENSSMNFLFHYLSASRNSSDSLSQISKVKVLVAGIGELQSLLKPTLDLNCTLSYGQNITISLGFDGQSMSASESAWGNQTYENPVAFHEFDIPASWSVVNLGIRITNPESYSVCWIVNVMVYGQVVNSNWQTAMYLGIASAAVGAVITGISVLRRKQAVDQKKTATAS
jgi:hypothetical protein